MSRHSINRICMIVPPVLSLMACVWVLGNVAGGVPQPADEGIGFRVFWLLILAQMPFILGYLVTANWKRHAAIAARLVLQAAALVLAFSPVAYFRL